MQNWNPSFLSSSPFFDPLIPIINLQWLQRKNWPSLIDYNEWANQHKIFNINERLLELIEQTTYELSYESLIYEKGQLPTREGNWHDFFNMLVWLRFPAVKAYLNQQHWLSASKRDRSQRTEYEQNLAHFDESGVIVICQNSSLLDLLKSFKWQELFWDNREIVKKEMHFFVFGHGLFEKLLNPYIGLTGCGLLIHEKYDEDNIEQQVINRLKEKNIQLKARDFQPIPLLGVPGYWSESNNLSFYQNEKYFRPGRKNSNVTDVDVGQ